MIDRFGGLTVMPYLYFYGGKTGGKKNRRLGESLNTANEALIHTESFLTQSTPCE